MIIPVRRFAATCALGALGVALTACGTPGTPHAARPGQPASATTGSISAAPSRPPTLAPGSSGLTPVFKNGPRTRDKTVALTFDADMTADQGPRAAAGEHFDNPRLIATLRAFKVPATVFMTGRWADEYPQEAKDIGRDPLFEVANHSYSHYAFTGNCYGLPTVPEDKMRADVERAYAAFKKAGVPNALPYFRFPGGCYDQQALRTLSAVGVTAVQWDVVSGDAFATDSDAVARQVLEGVEPGSVVVMHCTLSAAPATELALHTIVPELRKKGFRFVKVSELIGTVARGGQQVTS
ncbi:polysaccharide deacetylase family protein [Streptomyces sp. NBC_01136]|uniref:polysaccharide deacetylase family protein n=1 Tax=unclassified Streptomyces TaxID=2593676 RepID=UPI003246E021|nr:polysaccharide deacetylase family protein [Streptomyces sp. NBC_01136]